MEKYIIILVILATIYYIQNKLQLTEGFQSTPTQTIGGIDDSNSINTLAQISKQLMAGGVTVPGNMTVQGNMVFSNAGANFITINKGTSIDSKTIHIWNSDSQLILVGKNDANTDYSWPGIVLDTKKSNINTNTINVAGASNIGGALNVGGNLNNNGNGYFSTGKSKVQIGQGYREGGACVYAMGNDLQIGASTGITRNEGSLIVSGDFMLTNPIYRKHDTAGYFHIRGNGWKTPIYYGFNMMWSDHNIKEAVRAKWGWNESMFSNSVLDMRQSNDGDQNWTARYLIVFPGYKVKLYSWDGSFIDRIGVKGPGEHAFGDNNQRIHGIYVALAEEGDPPDRINW